ncbi:MAG: CYTH and CHAD domain-containing protein [Acidimicrobiia bacterium]|nr:CYTH and CHAD domain-containing protein [Acidimicrobiia bacterium]
MFEREVKLAVDDTFVVPELDDVIPGADLGPVEERTISDTYYDTADLRLARWGCTLRFRDGDGWTVKIPLAGTGRVLRRSEITLGGPPDHPPPPVLALVRPLTRGEPVAEIARFTTGRSVRTWRTPNGQDVAELADDRVRVHRPDGTSRSWRELEAQLADGADEAVLAAIVKRLEAAGAGDGGAAPKLIQAIGDTARAPADVVVPDLPDEPSAGDVIRAAVAQAVTQLLLQLPAASTGEDIEGVHRARVATRRLRSILRTFRPLLDPQWARSLEEDLRWLADDLGRIRDADVLSVRLRATVGDHPELETAATARVIGALEQQRRRASRALLDHLDRRRADRLFELLVGAAADPRTLAKAERSATKRLRRLVRRRWHRLERAIDSLDPDPLTDDLHRVRILAKRARYASEAVIPAVGRPAKRFATSIARLQDHLGELHDAEVAVNWLAELAETADGDTAFAAGRLAQAIADEGARFQQGWRVHYEKAARKRSRAWLR